MRRLYLLLLTSIALIALCFTPTSARSQTDQNSGTQRPGGRQRQRNFDPAQFQQRMMDRYRERLEITDDSEWKAVQPLIQNVFDARRAVGAGGRAVTRGNRRTGNSGGSGEQAQVRTAPASNPATEELQKAIDSKAPAPEMKAALSKYNEYRKSKRSELEHAQDALRAVLTSRQEAIATISGLL